MILCFYYLFLRGALCEHKEEKGGVLALQSLDVELMKDVAYACREPGKKQRQSLKSGKEPVCRCLEAEGRARGSFAGSGERWGLSGSIKQGSGVLKRKISVTFRQVRSETM